MDVVEILKTLDDKILSNICKELHHEIANRNSDRSALVRWGNERNESKAVPELPIFQSEQYKNLNKMQAQMQYAEMKKELFEEWKRL